MAPWGRSPADRRTAAWRRGCCAGSSRSKKVRRATAYVCRLGLNEFYLNGRKVGDHVLSPALTDYTKRACYVTYDVTRLRKGANAAGGPLGNGRFYAPRSKVPTGTASYGYPKLVFQMRIESIRMAPRQVGQRRGLGLTTAGPIQANNEYDGRNTTRRAKWPAGAPPGF